MATDKLKLFWDGLSTNSQTRAKIMAKICMEADVSYQHVKGVINKRRSMGADSATKLVKAINAQGGSLTLEDVILTSTERV